MASGRMTNGASERGEGFLALPLMLFYLLFFIAPLLLLFAVSLHADKEMTSWGLTQYAKTLTDGFGLGVLFDTLRLGVETTLLCLLLGFPLAWLHRSAGPRWQGVIILITVLPLLTSVIVRTFAWIVILGRQGIANTLLLELGLTETPLRLLYSHGGLVIALAQVQLPLMVLPLIDALQKLDPNLESASAALGAGRWRSFFRIVLPLSLPGIIAGSVLTFSAAVTAFITQSLVGGGQQLYMPMYIYQQALTLQNWPFAATISVIFMVAVLFCIALFNLLGRYTRRYSAM
ncbi:ABC transporter permease [Ferrovibrio sp.]|uniref:ABC transporter permease n=1 Tax=Ferrovibrio sp. TaxID=1917215 RepID=UPI0025BB8203|nr:ABC transporter permease [Ferrovibrio sp.]